MAKFKYLITDTYGKEKKGTLEAGSQEAAMNRLQAEGNVILEMKEAFDLENQSWNVQIGAGVKEKEIAVFCRQFYSILEAGVTVIDGLSMLQEQTSNKYLRQALYRVQTNVEKGESLAVAMEMESKVFPSILINMVAAGEATGKLAIAFQRMSVQFDKDLKLKSTVRSAMIYPIVVLVVTIIVIAVMMIFVLPNFESALSGIGQELPTATKIVMGMSRFCVENAVFIGIAIVLLIVGLIAFKRTEPGKQVSSVITLKIPIFRNLSVKSTAAKLCTTLSTLIVAGVPLVEGIGIVAKVVENRIIRKSLLAAQEEVMQGIPLSEPLERSGIFPPMLYHMLRIGEETGTTEKMLDKVADYYEDEVESATKALTTVLEPMIIIILALVIGTVVMAILMPMMSIYNAA